LIVTFRNLWNSVAAKWYVRPMIHQQNLFNAQVVGYLQALQDQMTEQEHSLAAHEQHFAEQERYLAEQRQRLQGQFRDVAENVRELTALAKVITQTSSLSAGSVRHDQESESS
jgi:hypothetical protein